MPDSTLSGTATRSRPPESALGPLKTPVFRMLWFTWLAANTTMWMNDVASAWLMTSIGPSPLWVALVQSAATLPVFLLGLPSGALADTLDRRLYFMATQFWVAAIATLLCVVILMDQLTAPLLLALTFANGIGLAMRWPVFAAIVPEIVSRPQLAQALALNGVAMNASRIIGPLIAGALLASVGGAYVFVLNATLSILAGLTIMRWRREHRESPLGREPLVSAMRVGVQFVWHSSRMRAVMLRIALFFLHSTAMMALLPLVARGLPGGKAGTFTVLLASMGVGAIVSALLMPKIRRWLPLQRRVLVGTVVQALAAVVVGFAPNIYLAVPAMVMAGAAWITVANSLTVAAQMSLPDWVRARGMSVYQMALMGSTAAGAALWGQVATMSSIGVALAVSAATGIASMLAAQRLKIDRGTEEELTPSRVLRMPEMQPPPTAGRILVRVEYRIDPTRVDDFLALMQESRRSRLRQGALEWQLLHDINEPRRYVEQIIDASWTEHLRRFDRISAADAALRDRRLAFHVGEEPPRVSRYVIAQE
ncbi:MAG TPA: MFS transporter [Ramlibacter sp.]|uniref:MFS transporter n=1 Tax=Ramlibacter sp. TaxID=1917967 RepID=UPI002D7EF1F4|nr:MFS transporter [Ramlibacter sp.]HET8748694.1 MFS transporter [Ramlibacter sp.]